MVSTLILEGQCIVKTGDQINLLRAPSGLTTSAVVNVQAAADRTTVTLRDALPSTHDTNSVAIILQRSQFMSVPMALLTTFSIAAGLGLIHGLLITRVRLQPFVVTLCALLIYRGWSRWLTGDDAAGFSEYSDTLGRFGQGTLPIILRGEAVCSVFHTPCSFCGHRSDRICPSGTYTLGRYLWRWDAAKQPLDSVGSIPVESHWQPM